MKDIDAVIAWVDGDDPKHIKKRKLYLSSDNEDKNDDIAGSTRIKSLGEIEFCVGSILKYAPFIRKIFI